MSSVPVTTDTLPSNVPKLDVKGTNWAIFAFRFQVAVEAKDLWKQFDGSSPQPSPPALAPVAPAAQGATPAQPAVAPVAVPTPAAAAPTPEMDARTPRANYFADRVFLPVAASQGVYASSTFVGVRFFSQTA
ncbi:hypothetical protein BU15DRAFT_77310 [Melanogaster broomeanus]|nr:hypothetical protein BU15DRAFT_77310 [Melanogaster broomeanus]